MRFNYEEYFKNLGLYIVEEHSKFFIVSDSEFNFKLYKNKIRNDGIKHNVSNCLDSTGYFKKLMLNHPSDKLSFDKFEYLSMKTPSVVTCSEHGDFTADPYRLINLNSGCRKCYDKYEKVKVKRKSQDQFIAESMEKFGDKLDYSLVKYVNTMTKVKLICDIHGVFEQTPNEHLQSVTGCGKCGKELAGGYSSKDYARVCKNGSHLYVFEFDDGFNKFYKIGISKKPLKRIKDLKRNNLNFIDGYSFYFDDSEYVWHLEKELHSRFFKYKYTPKIKFSGCTECFKDVNIDEVYEYINLVRSCFNCDSIYRE